MVSCHPVTLPKLTGPPPTFTVLGGLVPLKGLDRRLIGEVNYTPYVRIDGILQRLLAPDVLEGNFAFEVGVSQTPGVGDVAF